MGHWKQEPQSLMPTSDPTKDDVLFFAGFYEGEGSACGSKRGSCTVQVPQKDPEVLYRARSLWGGSIRINGRGISVWVLTGDRARRFLISIYPHMSTRRKQQIENAGGLKLTGKTQIAVGGIEPDRLIARSQMDETQRHSESCVRWAKNNPDKTREIAARSREKNREKINARQRERRAIERAEMLAARSKSNERSPLVN